MQPFYLEKKYPLPIQSVFLTNDCIQKFFISRQQSGFKGQEITNHRDTEGTEGVFLFARSASGSESLRLGEETAIGQKIAALRARSSKLVASLQRLKTD